MDKKSFLFGKRFLITQPMIRSFCGSTMVTLELAKYLSSVGAKVVVYTNVAFPPALPFYKEAGIKVITSQDKFKYSLGDFDYIWVHSLTFPQVLLDELEKPPKKMPAIVFLHMSPLDSIPDEHPWIYDFENSLSSLSLYISDKTLESNEKYGLPPKTSLFRNPAPLEFEKLAKRKVSQTLKKVLIVSNHPPKEILEAKKLLVEFGVEVDIFGEGQDKYLPLSPEALKGYDAVVTIGKTVQYCIVGELPVYIYDWYGGPGWLKKSNYEFSRINNFSGRFSKQKTGDTIAKEIVDGYDDALKFHLGFLAEKKDEYRIDTVLESVLNGIKPRKTKALKSEYIQSVKAAVGCAEIRFQASEELGNVYNDYNKVLKELDECRTQIQQLRISKEEYEAFLNSKRMKILNVALAPHDKIKKLFKK